MRFVGTYDSRSSQCEFLTLFDTCTGIKIIMMGERKGANRLTALRLRLTKSYELRTLKLLQCRAFQINAVWLINLILYSRAFSCVALYVFNILDLRLCFIAIQIVFLYVLFFFLIYLIFFLFGFPVDFCKPS